MNANDQKYGSLLRKFENAHSSKQNLYPATVTEAFQLLLNYKPESNADHHNARANRSDRQKQSERDRENYRRDQEKKKTASDNLTNGDKKSGGPDAQNDGGNAVAFVTQGNGASASESNSPTATSTPSGGISQLNFRS